MKIRADSVRGRSARQVGKVGFGQIYRFVVGKVFSFYANPDTPIASEYPRVCLSHGLGMTRDNMEKSFTLFHLGLGIVDQSQVVRC